MICVNDLLIIVGSVLKELLELRRTRNRFDESPFRPKSFRTIFNHKIFGQIFLLVKFSSYVHKTTDMNLTDYFAKIILDFKVPEGNIKDHLFL
jgi:hypothetical protein